ncbi:hypothetical protein AB0B10_24980 [Micromonospora arborensis]
MQQWLEVIHAAGDVLAFTAAFTNLAITIISHRTARDLTSPSGSGH